MTQIFEEFGLSSDSSLVKKSSPNFISNEMVGIEVELEGLMQYSNRESYQRLPTIAPWWRVVADNSLRNMSGICAEFVFKEPMFGKDLDNAITGLYEVVPEPIPSVRTSVHVHLDVRNLSFEQLLRLLAAYVLVEPILFGLVDPCRKLNPYCVPINACTDYIKRLGNTLATKSSGAFRRTVGIVSGFKYTALNFLPVITQGSIEFRHKEGITDPVLIRQWVNAILSLKRFAMESEEAPTLEEIRGLVDEYPDFVKNLFRGVDIPNLESLSNESVDDTAIMAKCLLSEEYYTTPRQVFEESAQESPFWSTIDKDIRGYYFSSIIPRQRNMQAELEEPSFDESEALEDSIWDLTPSPSAPTARIPVHRTGRARPVGMWNDEVLRRAVRMRNDRLQQPDTEEDL